MELTYFGSETFLTHYSHSNVYYYSNLVYECFFSFLSLKNPTNLEITDCIHAMSA